MHSLTKKSPATLHSARRFNDQALQIVAPSGGCPAGNSSNPMPLNSHQESDPAKEPAIPSAPLRSWYPQSIEFMEFLSR